MKGIISLIVLAAILMIGCQENDSILEPQNDLDIEQSAKVSQSSNREFNNIEDDTFGKDLIDNLNCSNEIIHVYDNKYDNGLKELDLYGGKGEYVEKFLVNGSRGGKIRISHSWKNEEGRKINLMAALVIPKNAYEGDLEFAIIFDLENYALELYPSPFTFDKPLLLNLVFSGVDLTGVNTEELVFDYLDGEPENLEYSEIDIDVENNFLSVIGAKIPHFSRYGWTRTKPNN